MKHALHVMLVVEMSLIAALIAGCGDDASGEEDISPDSGSEDAGGSGGSGGQGGQGGQGGRSGQGGTGGSPSTNVPCGSQTCVTPAGAMGFITACCADEAASTCGTSLMGSPCSVPIPSDSRCPGLDIMGFIMLPSCCTDANQCGIDASMFGMPGCVDLATAAEQAEMMGTSMGIELPEPRACGEDGDAGTEDAGQ